MSTKMSTEKVNTIVFDYLRLKNDEYSLDLTQEKARELGVSKDQFENVVKGLKETNDFIREAKKLSNNEILLINPQDVSLESLQQMPQGNIDTNGQEEGLDGFNAPPGTGNVRFECLANAAPTPGFVCGTYSNSTWQHKTVVGIAGIVKVVTVPLYISGVPVSISFRTSDSNGGKCHWIAEM